MDMSADGNVVAVSHKFDLSADMTGCAPLGGNGIWDKTVDSCASTSGAGAVQVYQWSGATWERLGPDVVGRSGSGRGGFGFNVALSGDGMLLAASVRRFDGTTVAGIDCYSGESPNGECDGLETSGMGRVEVLQWDGTTWAPLSIVDYELDTVSRYHCPNTTNGDNVIPRVYTTQSNEYQCLRYATGNAAFGGANYGNLGMSSDGSMLAAGTYGHMRAAVHVSSKGACHSLASRLATPADCRARHLSDGLGLVDCHALLEAPTV